SHARQAGPLETRMEKEMLTGVGQVKNSATWGGAKTNPAPADNNGNATQTSRKRSNGKRVSQFMICLGLVLMFCISASADKKISRHLSPELYDMVLKNNPDQVVDVIVQYKKRFLKDQLDKATKRRAKVKRQLDLIQSVNMSIPLSQV